MTPSENIGGKFIIRPDYNKNRQIIIATNSNNLVLFFILFNPNPFNPRNSWLQIFQAANPAVEFLIIKSIFFMSTGYCCYRQLLFMIYDLLFFSGIWKVQICIPSLKS